mgnify:FL=1
MNYAGAPGVIPGASEALESLRLAGPAGPGERVGGRVRGATRCGGAPDVTPDRLVTYGSTHPPCLTGGTEEDQGLNRNLIPLVCAFAVAIAASAPAREARAVAGPGNPAPDFTKSQAVTNTPYSLASFAGKVVVLFEFGYT